MKIHGLSTSTQAEHDAEGGVDLGQLVGLEPPGEVAKGHLWIDHPHLIEEYAGALPAKFDHRSPRCGSKFRRRWGHENRGDVHQVGLDGDGESLALLFMATGGSGRAEAVEVTTH